MRKIHLNIILSLLIGFVLYDIFSWSNPQIALANGPKLAFSFDLTVEDYPMNAEYVDILFKLDNNQKYVTYNEMLGNKYGIKEDSEIVNYNKNGYISYSFHFKNAKSDMKLKNDGYNRFAYGDFNYITKHCRKMKVAILDKNGSIIKMTKAYNIKNAAGSYLEYGAINYDTKKNILEGIDIYQNYLAILIMWFVPLIITLVTEGVIAIIFKFRKIGIILLMNLITNLSLSFFITFIQVIGLSYLSSIVIGEIFVYVVEYFILYLFYHKVFNKNTILRYTIIANTSSLVITLLFNWYLIYANAI